MAILNFKARTYWLISLILFLLGIGFVVLAIYTPSGNNTIFIVLMTIDLILLTFAIQIAIQKSIKYRPKETKYIIKKFKATDFDDLLKENKFKLRNRYAGRSYIKIDGLNAFKVDIITDSDKYFENVPEPENNDKSLSEKLDKCETFTGLEIFINPNDLVKERIVDFSIQTDKLYYFAIMKDDFNYVCLNYVEPNEKHLDTLKYLTGILKLEEIVDEE